MITRQYDRLFQDLAPTIPLAYLRALAYQESRMKPHAQAPGGGTGLLQITGIALKDYNLNAGGERFVRSQMYEVVPNIKVGGWLLRRIIKAYGRKSSSPNLQEDWKNPEFVKLLTAGWNTGWVALLRIDDFLGNRGMPTTLDNVYGFSAAAGRSEFVDARKKPWQERVAALFYREGGITPSERRAIALSPAVAGVSSLRAAAGVGAAALIGYGVWRYWR